MFKAILVVCRLMYTICSIKIMKYKNIIQEESFVTSLNIIGMSLWNQLQVNIMNSKTLNAFKSKFKKKNSEVFPLCQQ